MGGLPGLIIIMKMIETLEDAQSLSERNPLSFSGEVVLIPYYRELVAVDLEDSGVLFFKDRDGRLMEIGYDSEGVYKYEVC